MTGLTILKLTQHWSLIDGAWYRDAWIRDAAGCVRFVGIRDDLVGGAM